MLSLLLSLIPVMAPPNPTSEDRDWGSDKLLAGFGLVQDLLLQLNAHKPVSPTGIHAGVL